MKSAEDIAEEIGSKVMLAEAGFDEFLLKAIRAIQTDTIKAAAEKLHTVPRMIKFGNLADHVRAASAGDYEAVILSLIPEA